MEEKSTKSDVERITEAIKADALETCKLKKYSSAIHLMVLINVIRYPIVSVYPVSAKLVAPRELFHGIYLPRDQKDATNVKSTSLYLLWTSDEALESFWGQTKKKKEPDEEKTAEKLAKESFFSKFAGFKKKTEEKEVTNTMKEEKEVAMLSEKKGATKKIEEEQVTKKTEEEDVMEEKKKM